MSTVVKIEGQTVPIEDEIGKTNKGVIDALLPYYPAIANADIKREEKEGKTIITVTKKAGEKGNYAPVLTSLDKAPETISRMLQIHAAPPASLTNEELDRILLTELEVERSIESVLKRLQNSEPQPAATSPKGF